MQRLGFQAANPLAIEAEIVTIIYKYSQSKLNILLSMKIFLSQFSVMRSPIVPIAVPGNCANHEF